MITSGTHYDFECHVCGAKETMRSRNLAEGWACFYLDNHHNATRYSALCLSEYGLSAVNDSLPAGDGAKLFFEDSKSLCPKCRGPYDAAVKALEVLVELRDEPEKFKGCDAWCKCDKCNADRAEYRERHPEKFKPDQDDLPPMTLEETKVALAKMKASNARYFNREEQTE